MPTDGGNSYSIVCDFVATVIQGINCWNHCRNPDRFADQEM